MRMEKPVQSCFHTLWIAGFVACVSGASAADRLNAQASSQPSSQVQTPVQGPALTLEQAIRESKAGNPQIQQLKDAVEIASWRKLEALASGPIPRISLSANHSFNERFQVMDIELGGRAAEIPVLVPYTVATIRTQLTVYDGWATWNSYDAAIHSRDAAQLDLSRSEFQLENEVRTRFYQALAAQQLLEVADQNIKTLEEHLADAKRQARSGVTTNFDVLRIEVQLSEARPDKLAAEDNVAVTRLQLAQVMGTREDTRPLEGVLPEPVAEIVPADLKLDPQNRQDLKAQQEREEVADRERRVSRSYWVPRLSLFMDNQWYNNRAHSISNMEQFRYAYSIGFLVNWNIFDGGASIARHNQSELRQHQVEAATQALVQRIPVEFENWKRRYLYSVAQFRARSASIDKAKESVRLARAGVSAGTRTNTEFLDAELDLFRARAGAVRAKVDAIEALGNLELALGRRLGELPRGTARE